MSLYTPRPATMGAAALNLPEWENEGTWGRRALDLSEDDLRSLRVLVREPDSEWVKVTDRLTGIAVLVRPASCGAACFCGAEFIPA